MTFSSPHHRLLGSALMLLFLGGCSIFRTAPVAGPQDVTPKLVTAGLPSSARLPPLPATRDPERTYTAIGRNTVFFSATSPASDVVAEMSEKLASDGYDVRGPFAQDGATAFSFSKDGKLGAMTILTSAPTTMDRTLDMRGTYVEITYDLTAPPTPNLTPGGTPPARTAPSSAR